MKKATRYFLPRANFSKGPIALGIEINLERFLIRSDIHLGFHNFQDVGIYWASQPPSSRPPESLSSRAKSRDPDAKSQSVRRGILRLRFAPLRMTRDRAPWRGELCESAVVKSVAELRPPFLELVLPACGPYNRTLSTAFAAIHPRCSFGSAA